MTDTLAPALTPEAQRNASVIAEFLRQARPSRGGQAPPPCEEAHARAAAPAPAPAPEAGPGPLPQAYDPVSWAEQHFYIPQQARSALPKRITLLPHQKTILRLMFDPRCAELLLAPSAPSSAPHFQTLIYSTVKKSGKTTIAALLARWATETWGSHSEVYALANDLEQARGRIYSGAMTSIQLDPRYRASPRNRGIPGLWRIIERQAVYLPTFSTLRAVSTDYRGEAGSNPVATFWSELWGYALESSLRLWDELTPVPTHPRSIRFVETYAGYEGESSVLNELDDRVHMQGRRLTHADLALLRADPIIQAHYHGPAPDPLPWPFPATQPLPFYIHAPSRTFAYWDDGPEARRMPWQTPEYYETQAATLRPPAFERLHLNHRASSVDEFIPVEWWDRLALPPAALPPLTRSTPLVVGADASVSGDYTALVAVSRDPRADRDAKVAPNSRVLQRLCAVFAPSPGRPLDYSQTIEPLLREWCSRYNVVEVAYDIYQLHDLMTRLRNEAVAWCRPFSQQGDRLVADKALFDLIRDQRIHHTGDPALRAAIQSCGAQIPPSDNTKLRLVKKSSKSKIDPVVALSMASHECMRLNLA